MSRVILNAYLVQYPLGGYLSWMLQWLIGLKRLGHDVYLVEKSLWANSCYDPSQTVMSDDCSYGAQVVNDLLAGFELSDRWCYSDFKGVAHGLSKDCVQEIFRTADVFLDLGAAGAWDDTPSPAVRVLVDGRPGRCQMRMESRESAGDIDPQYDFYFTVGQNVGTEVCQVPTARKQWRHIFYPVVVDQFPADPPPQDSPFTTVMAWAHDPYTFEGTTYAGKDIEFAKFMTLPKLTRAPMEVAAAGRDVPWRALTDAGWRVREATAISMTRDSFCNYIRNSRGEFTVCKNLYVATNSGWFGDREAAYLASGRPVVIQDTGFSRHLPCGEGLFAVRTVEEAAAAIERIDSDYQRQSAAAREIARKYLDVSEVLAGLFREIGMA